tara:strand:- start:231 stop:527 length:297 start_codon:yes stop_codon:yes gene_type:complete
MTTYYVENANLASKKFEDLTIQSVLEDWITDRKLPRTKKAFLKQVHLMNLYGDDLPSICPSYFSSELDLPNGSSWSLVVADLLDHLEKTSKHKCELED